MSPPRRSDDEQRLREINEALLASSARQHELTEQAHEAEAKLQESEARLLLALDAAEMGTFVWHVEEDRGEPDVRMLALFGEPPDGVLNLTTALSAMIHPDDRSRYAAAVERSTTPGLARDLREDIRVVRADGSERWLSISARTAFDPITGQPTTMAGAAIDITERKQAEERQRLLLAELQHRVRNTLAVVRSIARRTARTSETVEDYAMHLDGRLNSLARVQAAVTRDPAAGIDLQNMVAEELISYAADEDNQVSISGPPIRLRPKAAEIFGLALHELATNAVKHGALSEPDGRLQVTWRIANGEDGERLNFNWTETGVDLNGRQPRRSGFGTELLERTLAYDLNATTALAFEPGGLRYTAELPLTDRIALPNPPREDGRF